MAVVRKKLPPSSSTKLVKRRDISGTVEKYTLPTAPSVPSDNLGDYSQLWYGDKKIGKTTLASFFPGALFLMTEPGAKSLGVFQRPIPDWKAFKAYVKLLQEDDMRVTPTFLTTVVDTVDLAFKMCEKFVCFRMGIDHPSDEDWGRGWSGIRDEFTAEMKNLLLLNKGLILISHSTDREIKTRSGQKYHRVQPTMSGQARDIIEGLVDIFCHYTYEGDERVMIIRGDEHVIAGHRLQNHFRTPEGHEVKKIFMDPTAEAGYANFMAAWNNRYVPPQQEQSEVPSESSEDSAPAARTSKPVKKLRRG